MNFSTQSAASTEEKAKLRKLISPLSRHVFLEELEPTSIVVEVHPSAPTGSTVASLHKNWRPDSVQDVESPDSLPRMEAASICPEGAKLVEISYIQKTTGGMSSYYGFVGYFLSLIVGHDMSEILDARGENAS